MKKFTVSRLLLIPLLVFTANTALAQEDTHKADREEFLKILAGVESAINEKRFEDVLDYLHDDVNVIYQNAEVADGKEAVLEFYQRMFTGKDALLKDISTNAAVGAPAKFYGNVAVAYGSAVDTVTYSEGRSIDLPVAWSVTLLKENGEWKVISLHLSINAFDNPILSKLTNLNYLLGVGGLLAGLILGFLFAKKRKNA